jgi:hypothetical protein
MLRAALTGQLVEIEFLKGIARRWQAVGGLQDAIHSSRLTLFQSTSASRLIGMLFSLVSLTLDARWNDSGLPALMVVERETFEVATQKTSLGIRWPTRFGTSSRGRLLTSASRP